MSILFRRRFTCARAIVLGSVGKRARARRDELRRRRRKRRRASSRRFYVFLFRIRKFSLVWRLKFSSAETRALLEPHKLSARVVRKYCELGQFDGGNDADDAR